MFLFVCFWMFHVSSSLTVSLPSSCTGTQDVTVQGSPWPRQVLGSRTAKSEAATDKTETRALLCFQLDLGLSQNEAEQVCRRLSQEAAKATFLCPVAHQTKVDDLAPLQGAQDQVRRQVRYPFNRIYHFDFASVLTSSEVCLRLVSWGWYEESRTLK